MPRELASALPALLSLGQADAPQGTVKRGRNITPGTGVKSGFICLVSEAYFREVASYSVSEMEGFAASFLERKLRFL